MPLMPRITFVLPSLNAAEFIEESIQSVLGQTMHSIELICVDAGSTDGTLEILRKYETEDARIKVLYSDKKSYGYQMNIGLDAATGEYLGIIEADDWILPKMAEELYCCAKEKNLDFVKADFYRFTVRYDGSLAKNYIRITNNEFYNRIVCPKEEKDAFSIGMNTWTGIYSLQFLRKWNIRHNETPGASYQDNGFWFQTICRGERAWFINKPYYMNRRDNANSSVFSTGKVWCMKNEYDYIRGILDSDPSNLACFIPMCNKYRFIGYYYNTLFRIASEYRRDFVLSISNEFRRLEEAHEIDKELFNKKEWEELSSIMNAPESYLAFFRDHTPVGIATTYRKRASFANDCKISVIVPMFNVEKYLGQCIASVLNQSMQDFEIICVNDGSTDGTLELAKRFAADDERISIIEKENGGLSSARNAGLRNAKGKYVLFLDSDDGIAKNALKTLYDNAEKNEADIVVCGIDPDHYPVFDTVPQWIREKNPKRSIVFSSFTADVLFKEPGAKPFVWRDFFKRAFLVENELLFHEDCLFGEDTIFQFCAFPKAKNISFIPDKLYYYRCSRPDSLMAIHNKDQKKKCMAHLDIISYIRTIWKKEGMLPKLSKDFSNWALSFFYNEYSSIGNDDDKSFCAVQFLKLLPTFCVNEIGIFGMGNRERLTDIRLFASKYEVNQEAYNRFEPAPHNEVSSPVISFIVPVHNMECFIGRTLASLLGQTEKNIEVICVDDASEDRTLDVVSEFAKTDKRLKVIKFKENKTANQARKEGVLAARGQYILFCDADDTYELDACERLMEEVERKPADIIHFGTNVILNKGSMADKQWLDANLIPFAGTLHDKQVFLGCFRYNYYAKNLWNKLFSAELAKRAFSEVEDGAFPRGQDIYAFFLLAYYAQSYRGIGNLCLYNYNLATGMDGKKEITTKEFERFNTFPKVLAALKRFMEKEGVFEKYQDIWMTLRSNMFGDCVNKWQNKILPEEKAIAFDIMADVWPAWMIAESIGRRYWDKPEQFFELMDQSSLFAIRKEEPKVIATYYHKIVGGGAEKVLVALAELWVTMGYKVVVISDEGQPNDIVSFSEGIIRYSIPNQGMGEPDKYWLRGQSLQNILEKEHVDVFVYHAWNTGLLPWDMLTVKLTGCAFIVHCHSLFSLRLFDIHRYYGAMPKEFGFADGIVCLSAMDREYWKQFNTNVFQVNNPITIDIEPKKKTEKKQRSLLFVGRLASEKRPEAVLEIFQYVLQVVPDTTLRFVGTGLNSDVSRLKKLSTKLGINEKVEWCGFQKDVRQYYRDADVLVSTSQYEGYPLNLVEAMCTGTPVVMYELPFLTLVKGNKGIISVPQLDTTAAAKEIISLLTDDEKYEDKVQGAESFAMSLQQYDYKRVWKTILVSVEKERQKPALSDAAKEMWNLLFSSYITGAEKVWNEINQLKYRNNDLWGKREKNEDVLGKLQNDVISVRSSYSFRIGRVLTWIPRKIRGGIRCYKEHGLQYTVHRIFEHLSRKI